MQAVVTGDIGGTSGRLELWGCSEGATSGLSRLFTKVYASSKWSSLTPLVAQFLADASASPTQPEPGTVATAAPASRRFVPSGKAGADAGNGVVPVVALCVAVCGPVVNGALYAENLDWTETCDGVAAGTGIPRVSLLNDFVALGLGLTEIVDGLAARTTAAATTPAADEAGDSGTPSTHSPPSSPGSGAGAGAGAGTAAAAGARSSAVAVVRDLGHAKVYVLHDTPQLPDAPVFGLGAGTGLGMVYLTSEPQPDGGRRYVPWPSEGGMTCFTAQTDEEWALSKHIAARAGNFHVETEHVVSGQGIANAFWYLVSKRPEDAPDVVAAVKGMDMRDVTGVVATHAVEGTNSLCVDAVDMVLGAFFAEAGNCACRALPHGGLFLTGGVSAKLASFITEPTRLHRLLERYLHRGARGTVLTDVIKEVPLFLVSDEGLGMTGARIQAERLLVAASSAE